MKNLVLSSFIVVTLSACAQIQKKHEEVPAASPSATTAAPTRAQAVLKAGADSKIKGIIHFSEDGGKLRIETMIDGLKPGPHGFHIHEVGDCSKADFSSAGGHFNPGHSSHGSLSSKKRHAGDFGNLMADAKGKAHTTLLVEGLTVRPGAESIMGRAVVIHKDKDDLKSQPAGNSGPREACGVVESL